MICTEMTYILRVGSIVRDGYTCILNPPLVIRHYAQASYLKKPTH